VLHRPGIVKAVTGSDYCDRNSHGTIDLPSLVAIPGVA
jgi:hypothetical protein